MGPKFFWTQFFKTKIFSRPKIILFGHKICCNFKLRLVKILSKVSIFYYKTYNSVDIWPSRTCRVKPCKGMGCGSFKRKKTTYMGVLASALHENKSISLNCPILRLFSKKGKYNGWAIHKLIMKSASRGRWAFKFKIGQHFFCSLQITE